LAPVTCDRPSNIHISRASQPGNEVNFIKIWPEKVAAGQSTRERRVGEYSALVGSGAAACVVRLGGAFEDGKKFFYFKLNFMKFASP